MNELERLARWHQAMADEPKRNQEKREKHAQTAAILLAASKVDVAGLMELVAKVSNAAYVAGLQDANGEGCDATAQTLFEDELETALRMALAQRGWVVDAPGIGRVIATGRYTNAVQVEASLVPQGSNQGALIQRAAAAYRTGDLSPDELDAVEVIYGTRLRPARSYSIPANGGGTDAADAPQMTQEGEPMQTGTAPMDVVRAFLGEGLAGKLELHRSEGRGEWEMAARVLAAEQAAVQSAADEVKRQADEAGAAVRTGLGLADGEDLATGLARIASERQYGQAARVASLDALCESYVRAHGVAEGWDKAAFLARRTNWSPADIDAERGELDKVAQRTFKAGSTAETTVDDGTGADAPASKPVKRVVPGFTNA